MIGRRDSIGINQGRQYGGDHGTFYIFYDCSTPDIRAEPRQNSRPQSMEFDSMRSQQGNNNLQNFYGNARYPPRSAEGDPMHQAKRRMAAQRERELRNYHQEQQYNRSMQ